MSTLSSVFLSPSPYQLSIFPFPQHMALSRQTPYSNSGATFLLLHPSSFPTPTSK